MPVSDPPTLEVAAEVQQPVGFRKFLAAIDKAVPAGLDVHLACDNYATCNTAEIRTWLARHPRFHVRFTPAGSSWMNQAGRWFGLLTDKLIRRGVRTSVQAPGERHQGMDRHLERRPQAVRLDEDRRRDPELPGRLSRQGRVRPPGKGARITH